MYQFGVLTANISADPIIGTPLIMDFKLAELVVSIFWFCCCFSTDPATFRCKSDGFVRGVRLETLKQEFHQSRCAVCSYRQTRNLQACELLRASLWSALLASLSFFLDRSADAG